MVALRLFALLLAASFALPAHADVFPYEVVTQVGRNNIIDSNALSCDPGTFSGGTWINSEGCYTRTGTRCSANPTTCSACSAPTSTRSNRSMQVNVGKPSQGPLPGPPIARASRATPVAPSSETRVRLPIVSDG